MRIKHIYGDILKADADCILHQVNCQGKMNSGLAKQIRAMFPEVFETYVNFCSKRTSKQLLGNMLGVAVHSEENKKVRAIMNLFAQEYYGYDGKCYTDYKALEQSLYKVKQYTQFNSLAIPYKMGCCRGGGDWNKVYSIIEKVFKDTDTKIFIYELDKG